MKGRVLAAAAALVGLLVPAVTEAKTRDCSDTALVPYADLRRCDLRPLALATLDLHGADMRAATLSHMALGGGADGPRTNFAGVRLDRAHASGTAFGDLDLTGASLRQADLRATGWEDTTARNADLTGADLRGASLTFGGFSGASFRRADLRDAELHSIYAAFIDVRTDFRRADLSRADLSGAALAGARFERARLVGADFSGAQLGFASFDGADLTGAVWSNTTCPDGTNSDANGGTCLGHLAG